MAANRWQNCLVGVEQFLVRIVAPIQQSVDVPLHAAQQAQLFFSERLHLLTENGNLQQEHIHLQAQIQKLQALEAENLELRKLLQTVGKEKDSFSEARLIHVDADPFSQQIMLNKGKQDAIDVGQPVIDAQGLVGIVLSLTDKTSRVLMLTDKGFAVPVQSVRSGERAIATGSGMGSELRLNYVPRTADFVEGDQLVTSGLGGKFPAGFPVGVITSIQHDPSTRFTLIGVRPSAKLGQLRHVLFVKRDYVPSSDSTVAIALKPQQTPDTVAQTTVAASTAVAAPKQNIAAIDTLPKASTLPESHKILIPKVEMAAIAPKTESVALASTATQATAFDPDQEPGPEYDDEE